MKARTKIQTTTGTAIGLGAIASFIGLCCLGPWAVTLFGVSGAITLARYVFLRPYIMMFATILLAWSFWQVYRPQAGCNEGNCATGQSKWLKVSLWLASFILIIAFFSDSIQWLLVNPTPEK